MVLAAIALYLLISLGIYFGQDSFIFQGAFLSQDHKFNFPGENFEEVFLEAEDGVKVNGLHFKAENSQGIVLYFHGNAGNIDGYGQVAPDFTQNGWDIFMIDYHGYGKTPGKASEKNMYADAELAWNYAKSKFPAEKIVIYGRSLGSSPACQMAINHPEPALLMLETPFYSLKKIAAGTFWMLPVPLLLKHPMRNDLKAPQVKMPVVIFHGTNDEVVPFEQGKALTDLFAGEVSLFTIEGGHHNDLGEFPAYQLALREMLPHSTPTDSLP